MPVKKDVRSQMTEQILMESMLELLRDKPYQKITVNDLCVHAAVSRTTFYQHYEDKLSLVAQCMEYLMDRIVADSHYSNNPEVMERALVIFEENASVFNNLLQGQDAQDMKNMLSLIFVDYFIHNYEKRRERGERLHLPVQMLAVYKAAGFSTLLLMWIGGELNLSRNDMRHCLTELHARN